MWDKLKLLFSAFRQGSEIANAAYWKGKQVDSAKLAAFLSVLVLIAKQYGYDTGVDDATILAITGGIYAAVNFVLTNITSKKVGISSPGVIGDVSRTDIQPESAGKSAREVPAYTEDTIAEARRYLEISRGRHDGFESKTD